MFNEENVKLLNKRTKDFKVEIGTVFKDDKRDLVIIGREYIYKERKTTNKTKSYIKKEKWYKYKCNNCGWDEGRIIEGELIGRKTGCSCCYNRTSVQGINTIWDTDRWMIDLGVSEEDAKRYTRCSGKKIVVTCPDCGESKIKKIDKIYRNKSIGCKCGDGMSYPSKYVYSLLKQLNIEFNTEVKYEWNKYINPLTNKLSQASIDFIIVHNNREIPIEVDGEFHRKDNRINGQTKEQSEYIDKQRDENCLKYLREKTIRISDEGNIKNNILNSKLNELFNLDIVDWNECEKYSLKNISKYVCEYWNNKEEWETTLDVSKAFNISRSVTIKYLNKGSLFTWCNYNGKKETSKSSKQNGLSNGKPVEIFKQKKSLGIFKSISELSRQSERLFGVKLNCGNISSVCNGNVSQYKGFTFNYI